MKAVYYYKWHPFSMPSAFILMNDNEFDKFLQTTENATPLPAVFRGEVWRRIEQDNWRGHSFSSWVENHLMILTKPLFATISIFLMTLVGLTLGLSISPKHEDLKSTYVETISPFMAAHQK